MAKQFIQKIINFTKRSLEHEGLASSKRLIAFISFSLLTIYFFANLFFDLVLKDSLEDTLFYIVLGGLSLTTGETIMKGKSSKVQVQNVENIENIENIKDEDPK